MKDTRSAAKKTPAEAFPGSLAGRGEVGLLGGGGVDGVRELVYVAHGNT